MPHDHQLQGGRRWENAQSLGMGHHRKERETAFARLGGQRGTKSQLLGEEGEWGPRGTAEVLQDSPQMGIGSINNETDGKVCPGVLKLGNSGQSCLGGLKGLVHWQGSKQGLTRPFQRVGEGEQKPRHTAEKQTVEVDKPEEAPELKPCGRAGKLDDDLHMDRERADTLAYIIFSKNPSSQADVAWRSKHRFFQL